MIVSDKCVSDLNDSANNCKFKIAKLENHFNCLKNDISLSKEVTFETIYNSVATTTVSNNIKNTMATSKTNSQVLYNVLILVTTRQISA